MTKFKQALSRLQEILGKDSVITNPETLTLFSKDTSPWERECLAVVYPKNAREVQSIVKIAGEFGVPIWTFSRGKNWGYGATVALKSGALIVILERMNRILEINSELAFAVIEPGVTQKQLNDTLKESKIKLWADCTDSTPDCSVVGNALERGVGYTPYGDHFGHLCGLEVVLPNGEIVQTGAANESSKSWHTYKYGTGPYLEGLFSQSNYGIVVKAGLWLLPEPEQFSWYSCTIEREDVLPEVVDAIRRLALKGTIQSHVHLVNDFASLAVFRRYPYELLGGRTHLTNEVKKELRKQYGLTPYTLSGGIYGNAEQVAVYRREIKSVFSQFGRVTFLSDRRIERLQKILVTLKKLDGAFLGSAFSKIIRAILFPSISEKVLEVVPHVFPIYKGIPGEFIVSRAEYFKSRKPIPSEGMDPVRDNCGLTWFAPIVPMTARHTREILSISAPLFEKYGFDLSFAGILLNSRSMVALMGIYYDRENLDEMKRSIELYEALSVTSLQAGYHQYRINTVFSDRVLNQFPDFKNLTATLKRSLDPHNILAPGKYGVGVP